MSTNLHVWTIVYALLKRRPPIISPTFNVVSLINTINFVVELARHQGIAVFAKVARDRAGSGTCMTTLESMLVKKI
jgi:hypothetical protein